MSRALGDVAEERAAQYLLGLGYILVTRGYTVKGGEIDIIALDGDELVFVEVKSRKAGESGPEGSLSSSKMECLRHAAEKYRSTMGETSRPFRFDLIAISESELRHHIRLTFAEPVSRSGEYTA